MNIQVLMNQYRMNKEFKGAKILPRYFYPSDAKEKGYILDKNPGLLVNSSVSFAGMQVMQTHDIFTGCPVYTAIISTDDNFDLLSDNTKEFIIQHELGHFDHKDLITGVVGRQIALECEADMHAALVIGKDNAINALKELRKMCVFSIEITKRINHIKRMEGLK